MSEAEHVRTQLLEHFYSRRNARERLRRAQDEAAAAEHRLARAMRQVLDASGIIAEEQQAIDRLLEELHALIPRQRNGDDS